MNLEYELRVVTERLQVQKCDKCPKFLTKLEFNKHMEYHKQCFLTHVSSAYVKLERIKQFVCNSCCESFSNKSEYLLHKIKHVQNNARDAREKKKFDRLNANIHKPLSCPDCDYKFVTQKYLDEHSILHKPFPHICECGIGYYKQRDLVLHMRLVHKTELNELKPKRSPSPEISSPRKHKGPTLKAVLIKKEKVQKENNMPKHKSKIRIVIKKRTRTKLDYPDIDFKCIDNKFECPVCKKHLMSKRGLYIHYRIHTGERPYSCDVCNKRFNQTCALSKHKLLHIVTDTKYKCSYCDKTFRFPEGLARHELIHGEKLYECNFCNKGFHDPSAFARHKRIHTGDKRYKCPYCPMAFTDVSGYKPHVLRHENKRDFSCDICGKSFITRNELGAHKPRHDTYRERNYECDYCSKTFATKYYLQSHIMRHTSKKKNKFKCSVCSKKFYTNSEFNSHYKSHNIPYFECDKCSKLFKHKYSLIKHFLSVHEGVKCDKCPKYFASKSDLEKHEKFERGMCIYR